MDDTGGIAAQNVVQYDPLAACLQRKARLSESKYFLIADSYSKPFTGSPKVLLITTQGRPAHLTCGQTIARIIIPRPRSWRKGQLPPLSGQNASLETKSNSRRPIKGRQLLLWFVMALFPVSLAQAGTYPHGWYSLFKLQDERFFFPVRPIAQEKGRKASCFKKIF